jgi:hypothetical protein
MPASPRHRSSCDDELSVVRSRELRPAMPPAMIRPEFMPMLQHSPVGTGESFVGKDQDIIPTPHGFGGLPTPPRDRPRDASHAASRTPLRPSVPPAAELWTAAGGTKLLTLRFLDLTLLPALSLTPLPVRRRGRDPDDEPNTYKTSRGRLLCGNAYGAQCCPIQTRAAAAPRPQHKVHLVARLPQRGPKSKGSAPQSDRKAHDRSQRLLRGPIARTALGHAPSSVLVITKTCRT